MCEPPEPVNVEKIEVEQNGRRFDNQHRNLLAVLDSDVNEEFYWWDDDHFLLERRDSIPSYHDMRLSEWLAKKDTPLTRSGHHAMGEYHQCFRACMDLLEALGYEDGLVPTHTPMLIHKERLSYMCDLASKVVVKDQEKMWGVFKAFYLSIYADVIESPQMPDPRWRQGDLTMNGFWATNRGTWPKEGRWIRDHFWRPSPFEGDRS